MSRDRLLAMYVKFSFSFRNFRGFLSHDLSTGTVQVECSGDKESDPYKASIARQFALNGNPPLYINSKPLAYVCRDPTPF
jgi:hypothetical protein